MRRVWVAFMAFGTLAAPAYAQTFPSSAGNLNVETIAHGLEHPWALAFLPDGRMLVTERPGRMRIVARDGELSEPLKGVPPVIASGQAGLLDVALDRDFAKNRTIYFTFNAERGGLVAVARARLEDDARSSDVKIIFREESKGGSNNHGSRIAQAPDGNLFVTLGDHFGPRDEAQNLALDNGKIIRIAPDGKIPPDNPFVGKDGARPEIWSYGHRNGQGLALQSGERQTVGAGARPAGRRRSEHHREGQELRLAGDRLRRRLRRRENPRVDREARHGAAGQILGAVDRALRHGVLHRRCLPRVERQSVHRRARRRSCWCGSTSTARKSPRKSACSVVCASASATCGRDRTARSMCSPTTAMAACCGVTPAK